MTPHSEQCPRCGGVLVVNQDGWKICHACGYSSPPGRATTHGMCAGNVPERPAARPVRASSRGSDRE